MKLRNFMLGATFVSSLAAQAEGTLGRFAIDAGAGVCSDDGILGGDVRFFPTNHWDLHTTGGLDFVGLIVGAGTAFFVDSGSKCLLLFSCHSDYMVSATAIRSSALRVSLTDSDTTGNYFQSTGYAASLNVGTYDTFPVGLTLGFEVGYRYWWQKPRETFVSGTFNQQDVSDYIKNSTAAWGIGITIGWRF